MPENLMDRLEFSYESIGASSYLIIKTGLREEILDYQVSMTGCNNIERLVQYSLKGINGYAFCYYNITSKLALSFFLKRRRLLRNEFVKLVADIMRTIADSAGYLLSDSGFLLDPDYVFINPENLEIAMVYVPVNVDGDTCKEFRDFLRKLILQLADIDENGSDNFLQRILAFVKNDLFNLSDFLKLLDGMLYNDEAVEAESCAREDEPLAVKVERINAGSGKKIGNKRANIAAMVLLSQLLIAAMVLLVVKYIRLPGGNSAVNYLALILIVIAIDIIILKNTLQGVKFNINTGIRNDTDDKMPSDAFAGAGDLKIQEAENHLNGKPAASCNTVLLGSIKTGFPVLKSRNSTEMEDIIINKPDFIIGRLKEQADFVSESAAVGKIHAQIINRNGTWFVKDLNSVNGTFVNDGRITSNTEHQLKDGDIVAFANCNYIFEDRCT
ncbi:MAG: FHA domain-containing protein [Ruminiclostridium sp.]|nr:FHA domain-containing protein [Ruminiclostridium sp.]